MILSYAFCNTSVMPVRAEPRHSAEQVNEVLFGERVEVIEITEQGWARILTQLDMYEGWCRLGQISIVPYKEFRKSPKFIIPYNDGRLVFDNGSQWLPAGADLFGFKKNKIAIYDLLAKYKGKKTAVKKLELSGDMLKAAAIQYLHAPYIWGGRTVAGIDCSGLSQMAYKLCGLAIPRDASQQAQKGETVDFLQNGRCGDLAFFDNAEGKIVHVGMLLDAQTIIHGTEVAGRVVIDKIDQGGIISTGLRRRTHNLRLVKRYF